MHTFQINALIRFVTSSTCFEPHGFLIRVTICTRSFCMVCFSCIYVSSVAGGRECSISKWFHFYGLVVFVLLVLLYSQPDDDDGKRDRNMLVINNV